MEQTREERPAQVLDMIEDGIIVAAARDSILIEKARDSHGRWLEEKQIGHTLGINKGDHFLANNKDLSFLVEG